MKKEHMERLDLAALLQKADGDDILAMDLDETLGDSYPESWEPIVIEAS